MEQIFASVKLCRRKYLALFQEKNKDQKNTKNNWIIQEYNNFKVRGNNICVEDTHKILKSVFHICFHPALMDLLYSR